MAAIDGSLAAEWLDDIRDRIGALAEREGRVRRDFAATLVGCVVDQDSGVVVHVGDGACVVRTGDLDEWQVPSWPAQGEYAATTFFVTDDPHPRFSVVPIENSVQEIAIFTDGLERLALEFSTHTAFAPFFRSMFPAIAGVRPGRDRALSRKLYDFLGSNRVTERTDDDVTLILARRI